MLLTPIINVSSLVRPQMRFYFFAHGANMDTAYVDIKDKNGWTNNLIKIPRTQMASTDLWLPVLLDLSSFSDTLQIRIRNKPQGVKAIQKSYNYEKRIKA